MTVTWIWKHICCPVPLSPSPHIFWGTHQNLVTPIQMRPIIDNKLGLLKHRMEFTAWWRAVHTVARTGRLWKSSKSDTTWWKKQLMATPFLNYFVNNPDNQSVAFSTSNRNFAVDEVERKWFRPKREWEFTMLKSYDCFHLSSGKAKISNNLERPLNVEFRWTLMFLIL